MISELRFYLALFWRRLPLFLLIFVLIAASGIFTAFSLPSVYRAQTRLLVESSQIPDNLAQSTVTTPAEEQLQLFQTRLLTRDNLLDIANRLRVFSDQGDMNPDQIVQAMRAETAISSTSGRNKASLMTVTFKSHDPKMAAQVLNEYLTFILNEDATYRTGRAEQTQQFFQQEVDRLGNALSQQSAKILDFKNKNSDALPDSMEFRRTEALNLQNQIAQADRDISNLTEQKQRLQQVFDTTGRVGPSGNQLSPEEQRIQTLKNQLAELQAVYAPDNPRVKALQQRISSLEAALANNGPTQNTSDADPAKAMFDLQMSEIDTKISQLQDDQARYKAQLEKTQQVIGRIPANAISLAALERDYDNIQTQYNTAVDRLSRASTGERIETLSRGQRVSVVEQPVAPSAPIKPNRKLIAVAGVLAGLVAGTVVVLALELLTGTVKRSADLVSVLGVTPLATIPYMRTRREIAQRRNLRIALSCAIGIVIPLMLWLVHTYYMPFDVIAQKLAARIGLYI